MVSASAFWNPKTGRFRIPDPATSLVHTARTFFGTAGFFFRGGRDKCGESLKPADNSPAVDVANECPQSYGLPRAIAAAAREAHYLNASAISAENASGRACAVLTRALPAMTAADRIEMRSRSMPPALLTCDDVKRLPRAM